MRRDGPPWNIKPADTGCPEGPVSAFFLELTNLGGVIIVDNLCFGRQERRPGRVPGRARPQQETSGTPLGLAGQHGISDNIEKEEQERMKVWKKGLGT